MRGRRYFFAGTIITWAVSVGACGPISDVGAQCEQNSDCNDLCSPIGECVEAASAVNLRISWTVNGVSPSVSRPSACAAIKDFEVQFESASPRDPTIAYFPVPCKTGQVFYPNMPARLVAVHMIGTDRLGAVVATGSQKILGTEIPLVFEFTP